MVDLYFSDINTANVYGSWLRCAEGFGVFCLIYNLQVLPNTFGVQLSMVKHVLEEIIGTSFAECFFT
jgi:hypothetical protein